MPRIVLENGERVPLKGKSILLIGQHSTLNSFINNENDYEIICFCECIDKTFNITIHKPAIIILENCINTIVNISGGMGKGLSQVINIGGNGNTTLGLNIPQSGTIVSRNGVEFTFSEFSLFKKINIA